jgi:hypothetical protein
MANDDLIVDTEEVSSEGTANRNAFEGSGQDAYDNLMTAYNNCSESSLAGEVGAQLREEAQKYLDSLQRQNDKGAALGQSTTTAGDLFQETGQAVSAALK